jgi:hypothetical protein
MNIRSQAPLTHGFLRDSVLGMAIFGGMVFGLGMLRFRKAFG